jgi:dienelactone hydrolase
MDYRGYGDSGGTPYTKLTLPEQRAAGQKWPGDVDVAFAYLSAQPGVRRDAIGAGGASCGVNQSIQLSRRHPDVKSLVLLSGNTNHEGRQFLRSATTLPLLLSAADDDAGAVELMAWLDACSANPPRFAHTPRAATARVTEHPTCPATSSPGTRPRPREAGAPAGSRAAGRSPDHLLVMMDDPADLPAPPRSWPASKESQRRGSRARP